MLKKRRKKVSEITEVDRGLVCENCRTPVPGNTNLCPKCGLNPGTQTITDIYPSRKKDREG